MAALPDPHKKNDPVVSLARYSEMGFIIPAAVLLGFFLGKLLDYWLHTKWLYLVGLAVWSGGGIYANDSHGGERIERGRFQFESGIRASNESRF